MDFGDLEEYGLDVKSGACGGKTCLDREKFKRYDQILNGSSKFGLKLGDESAKFLKRASKCHPLIKNHVTPKVEYIFTMFPLNLFTWWLPCGIPCDAFLWLIPIANIFIFIPFDLFVTIPWNLFSVLLVGSFILLIAGF